jgi:A/G-specific adenine glycosylase
VFIRNLAKIFFAKRLIFRTFYFQNLSTSSVPDAFVFAGKLLSWYQRHQRDLPWRRTQDPYLIWLSEIILQQTRVAQGLPYFERFVEAFPTVATLAQASEQEVLRLWQGLGYYSRARNLHQTAKVVAEQYGGVFPNSYAKLLTLKGVGSYTAAAIASFAFGERVAVLDGNVYRVLARVFGIETDIASPAAKRVFGEMATQLLPHEYVADYNQAIMEFGALQCVPVSPQCMFCPLALECSANNSGRQAVLPVKAKKVKVRERFFNYVVIQQGGQLALRQRPDKDIWASMYDFWLLETSTPASIDTLAHNPELASMLAQGVLQGPSPLVTHVLTHQRIQTTFWQLDIPEQIPLALPLQMRLYSLEEVWLLPKSTLVNNYLKERFF